MLFRSLGCYYLTLARDEMKGDGKTFGTIDDVLLALDAGVLETQTKIKLRWRGDLIDLTLEHNTQDVMRATTRENVDLLLETTAGRVIFNERLTRDGLPFVNGVMKKKGLQSLVTFCSATRSFNIVVVRAPRILSVVVTSGTNVTLQWESFPGKTYRVQSKDDLATGSWNSLGNDVPATGPVSTANDTMGVSQQRYYRVLLLD